MASMLVASLVFVPFSGTDSAEAASSTSTVVVRGTAFPNPGTAQLSFAGCASLPALTPETPRPVVGTGAVAAPSGKRSLGFDLVGGNAVGGLFPRSSMTQTSTADLQVYAAAGTTGVVYAGYQEPDDEGTTRVWVGRADVSVAAGAWRRVSATGLRFAWSKLDLGTGALVTPASAALSEVAPFARAHGGDGPGFYSVGVGCDGRPFSLDTFRVGTPGSTTVYDLEGLATTTTIAGTRAVVAGEPVRLRGSLRDQGGARVPGATLLLEEQARPGGPWTTVHRGGDAAASTDPVVLDAAGTDPEVELTPERTTTYRFRFVDRPLAEGSVSAPFVVTVTPTLTARVGAGRIVVGRMKPAVDGAAVSLHRAGGGGALDTGRVGADGRYELAVPAEVGGELVVRLEGVDGLEPATSDPVHVEALVAAPSANDPAPGSVPSGPSGPSGPASAEPPAPAPAAPPASSPADEPEPPAESDQQQTPPAQDAPAQTPATPTTPGTPSAPATPTQPVQQPDAPASTAPAAP